MTQVIASSGPLTVNDLREVQPGIYYTDRDVVSADQTVINVLKEAARTLPIRRARLCAHPTPDALQQDMLIVSHRDTYVAPHRHLTKSETMIVLEGEADAYFFDEAGTLENIVPMGSLASGRTYFYRMPAGRFHSLRITSELLVFVEGTLGPFVRSESENAPWAPAADDAEKGHAYLARLHEQYEASRRKP